MATQSTNGNGFDADNASLVELVDHIEDHYHSALRFDLGVLHVLADLCVEAAPDSLDLVWIKEHLAIFAEDVWAHLKGEERGIFRLIRGEGPESRLQSVLDVDHNHDQLGAQVAELAEAVASHEPAPVYADPWGRLVDKLRAVVRDFTEHSRIENDILFPRAVRAGLVKEHP